MISAIRVSQRSGYKREGGGRDLKSVFSALHHYPLLRGRNPHPLASRHRIGADGPTSVHSEPSGQRIDLALGTAVALNIARRPSAVASPRTSHSLDEASIAVSWLVLRRSMRRPRALTYVDSNA